MSARLGLVGEDAAAGALLFVRSSRSPEGSDLSNRVGGKVRRALAERANEEIA